MTNPADGLSPLRGVVVGLIVVLALIGLIELLTAIGGTVREGERDLLALKAIGLSPGRSPPSPSRPPRYRPGGRRCSPWPSGCRWRTG